MYLVDRYHIGDNFEYLLARHLDASSGQSGHLRGESRQFRAVLRAVLSRVADRPPAVRVNTNVAGASTGEPRLAGSDS